MMLVLLPPMHNCADEIGPDQSMNVSHSDEQNSYPDVPCSPFCGETGCGIVIDIQVNMPHIEAFFTKTEKRSESFEHLSSYSSGSLWHPPKS